MTDSDRYPNRTDTAPDDPRSSANSSPFATFGAGMSVPVMMRSPRRSYSPCSASERETRSTST